MGGIFIVVITEGAPFDRCASLLECVNDAYSIQRCAYSVKGLVLLVVDISYEGRNEFWNQLLEGKHYKLLNYTVARLECKHQI